MESKDCIKSGRKFSFLSFFIIVLFASACTQKTIIGHQDFVHLEKIDGVWWFVDGDVRRQGVGGALFAAGEAWAIEKGFTEIGSDTWLDNELSVKAHEGLGYEVVGRNVHFRKRLVESRE